METISALLGDMSAVPAVVKTVDIEDNVWKDYVKNSLFVSGDEYDIADSLQYVFKRLGKAVYLKIYNNELKIFLPFKNMQYSNYWQKSKDFETGRLKGFFRINAPELYLEDFALKAYDPGYESDILWIKNMFQSLCKFRKIKDCEFFFNFERRLPLYNMSRNFPDLTAFGTDRLDPEIPQRPVAVMSMCTSVDHLDIAAPTKEDWSRIESDIFGVEDFKGMKWKDKNDVFLFRSDYVNPGAFADSFPLNQKMALVKKIKSRPDYSGENFNIGISQTKNFQIIVDNRNYAPVYDPALDPDTDFGQLAKSKFIFVVDGVGHAPELSSLLFTGSCIIRIDSAYGWKCWYDDVLTPGIHYVSVKSDLSDLNKKIDWCISNDSEAEKIGASAREFAVKKISKNGMFDYLQASVEKGVPSMQYKETAAATIQMDFQISDIERKIYAFKDDDRNVPAGRIDLPANYDFGDCSQKQAIAMYMANGGYDGLRWPTTVLRHSNVCYIGKRKISCKVYDNQYQCVNDAFIGIKCMNELAKEIPNFCYTYFYRPFVVASEFIEGTRIDEFLEEFPDKHNEVMIQICLALELARERFCFEHGKMDPKHVIVHRLPKPVKITYRLSAKTWAVESDCIPVIMHYSHAKVLTSFDNKLLFERMFVGRYEHDEKSEKYYEENALEEPDKDLKNLLKKMGKKMVDKLGSKMKRRERTPFALMSEIVPLKSIKENKTRFGGTQEENPQVTISRLEYERLLRNQNRHSECCDRIFQNALPVEESPVGNVILQYEIGQSLKSVLVDFNSKFTFDVATDDRIKKTLEFVKNFYDKLIEDTADVEFDYDLETVDLWGIRMFIRKYLKPISENRFSDRIKRGLKKIMEATFAEAVKIGASNTVKFYKKFYDN